MVNKESKFILTEEELNDDTLEEVSGGAGFASLLPEGYIEVDTEGTCDNYQPEINVTPQTFNYGRCIRCEHLEELGIHQVCCNFANYRR